MKSTIRNSIALILAVAAISAPWSVSAQGRADSPTEKPWDDLVVVGDTLARPAVAGAPAEHKQYAQKGETDTRQLREDRWRRTVHGWEWLELERPAPTFLQLHPLLVAAFQLLVAVLIWLLAEHGEPRALATEKSKQ